MKVLLVATHLNAGGITSYALSLAKALKQRGCEIVLASGGGQFEETIKHPHYNIGINTKCEIGIKALKGALRLRQIIRKEKIDLVHAQTRVAALTSALACHWTKIPYLTTAHGFYTPHMGRRIFPAWGRAVIAISSQVLEHLKKDFNVEPAKIHLIYNGTDSDRYIATISKAERDSGLKKLDLNGDLPLIGIVARLSPVKGHRYLLEAIHEISKSKPIQCLVVGDGPSREDFLKRLKELKLNGAVRWIPWVRNPSEVLSLLDIFVLPSLQEGLSLSILEAQAAGIPVVATNVGGISEVVIDGKTGILVPSQDATALKEALNVLLENPSKAREMGEMGRENVKKRFSLSRMANQVIGVYKEVLQK